MSLAEDLADLVAPLMDAFGSPGGAESLLRELGVLSGPGPALAVPAQLTDLAVEAEAAVDALLALDDPTVPAAERTIGLVTQLTGLADAVGALAELDEQAVEDFGWPFDSPEVWSFLARTLPGYLLVRWLRDHHPIAHDALALAGVVGPGPDGPPTLDLDRLGAALSSPGPWAEALVDLGALVGPVRRHVDRQGRSPALPLVTTGQDVDDGDGGLATDSLTVSGDQVGFVVLAGPGRPGLVGSVVRADTRAGPGLALRVEGLDRLGSGIALGGGWTLSASGGAGTGGVLLGAHAAEVLAGGALDTAALALTGRPATPWALIGDLGASRVELASADVGLAGSNLTSAPDVALTFGAGGLRLVVSPGDADSFLAFLLGGEVSVQLALAGQWSPANGLVVDGAVGLTVSVPTTVTLGPLTLTDLTLALAVDTGVVALVVSTEIGGHLGPITVSIRGLGLRVELLDGDARGAGVIPLGPLALRLAFQPPSGATIMIDLGAAGGGWIDFDLALGRYSGVIALRLLGVGICAIVLVDTKALEGEWSLFFALFIDLPTIQLGFGFTLTGVGGLFGFNRDLDRDALDAAVRSGGLDTVLFPPDPIGDAPDVIAELSALFPPSEGRYVFGPVVKIGWGTPTLVEAKLGIVLSLPDPITVRLLGSITSILPTADTGLVAMHLDVGGELDSAAGTLSIDASLHDSQIAGFALAGDMAVRASFAEAPTFLMAVGGFHPGFDKPDGFPDLRRLSLGLSAAPVLDVSFECYTAITSNSVQFGASFHLSAEVAGFGIEGGTSFDALVEFSPFRLSTSLGWYVAVSAAGIDLAGVWLDASVEGPNPWLVVGTARFKFLGIEEHVRIDEQIGARRPEPSLPPAELLDELVQALQEDGAWSVGASTSPGVVLAATAAEGELVVTPEGTLAVTQRAVPLGIRLDRAGDAPTGPLDTFAVEPAGGALAVSGAAQEWFAPGYWFDLAPGERLSAPSFERMDSGVEFGGSAAVAGPARTGTLEYEQILRDPELGVEGTDPVVVDLGQDQSGNGQGVAMAGGRPRSEGLRVAADPGLARTGTSAFAVIYADSGKVVGGARTWSAAHQSRVGRAAGTVLAPSWEVVG